MIYIASPYSHLDPEVQEQRYYDVKEYTASLLRQGVNAFSPIVYGHFMGRPGDHLTWQHFNEEMMRLSSAMHVLQIPGWSDSIGIKAELKLTNELCLPTYFVAL